MVDGKMLPGVLMEGAGRVWEIWNVWKLKLLIMERETRFELATSSLGRRLSIDNKEHSVFVNLFLAIEFSQFSF